MTQITITWNTGMVTKSIVKATSFVASPLPKLINVLGVRVNKPDSQPCWFIPIHGTMEIAYHDPDQDHDVEGMQT